MAYEYEIFVRNSGNGSLRSIVFRGSLHQALRWAFCTHNRKAYSVWSKEEDRVKPGLNNFLDEYPEIVQEMEEKFRPRYLGPSMMVDLSQDAILKENGMVSQLRGTPSEIRRALELYDEEYYRYYLVFSSEQIRIMTVPEYLTGKLLFDTRTRYKIVRDAVSGILGNERGAPVSFVMQEAIDKNVEEIMKKIEGE